MADTGWQEPQGGIVQCMICGERFKSIEEEESVNHPHFTETETETEPETESAITTATDNLIDATYQNLIRPIRPTELSFTRTRNTYRNSEFGYLDVES